MHLRFSDEDEAFREEVRAFLSETIPPSLGLAEADRSHLKRAECADWLRTLNDKGWAAPGWPEQYGGTGWSPVQRYIWEVEYGLANAPELSVIALNLVGPLICAFGTDDLKQRFLGPICRGDIYFCQGFSEPQAGSDLVNVQTRALRQGDAYVITGQKIWTSHAGDADYMICLARTDFSAKPQLGLSMFIVPMTAPGISVRPINSIDGRNSVNEVFIDEVVVNAADRVGEENAAWTYAKFLLDNERTHNAHIGILKRYLERIAPLANAAGARYRERFCRLEIDILAHEWSVLRVIAAHAESLGQASASALKIRGSELLMTAAELEIDLLGPAALHDYSPDDAISGKMSQLMYWRASSIFGGSNEIQRSIIWNSLFR